MENEKFKIKDGVLIEYTGDDDIIEIPDTVSVIGENVFRNKYASKMIISNSVKIIEKNAFRCSGFGEIIMNDGVMIIKEAAFFDARCNSIKFSKNLKEIGNSAFYFFKYYDLETHELELPSSLIKIGDDAFAMSDWLVPLPKSVKEIGENSYRYIKIKEVTIPSKLNIISEGAFSSCSDLKKVIIENAKQDIIKYRDYDKIVEDVEKVTTVHSTTKIKSGAFGYCQNLEEIIFPNTLTEIGSEAFWDCVSLKKVNIIVDENLDICYNAFINAGVEEVYICTTKSLNIKEWAFSNLENLKRLKIIGTKNSSINIESYAFENCTRLEKIDIVTEGDVYIGDEAFKNCNELEDVNIIATGINMDNCVFENCIFLKRLNLQAGLTGVWIGEKAFANCRLLHTINTASEGTFSIYDNTFEGCISLEKINCGKIVSLKKCVGLYSYTPEEITNIVKTPEEIQVSINSVKKDNNYEEKSIHYNNIEDTERKEQTEKILEKLEEIENAIKKSTANKRNYNTSLDQNTIEDIIDGIWDIL